MLARGAQRGQFGFGQAAHFGILAGGHFGRFGNLLIELLEAAILVGQLGQRAVFARDRRHQRRIRLHRRIEQLLFQLLETLEFFFQHFA